MRSDCFIPEPAPRGRRGPALALAGVFLCGLMMPLGGCKRSGAGPAAGGNGAAPAVPVEVVEVTRGTVTRSIEVVGTVEASDDLVLGSVTTGEVVYVCGDEGDSVSAGQVVVRLDASDTQASLAQASAQVESAKARLAQAEKSVGLTDTKTGTDVAQAGKSLEQAQARLQQAQLNRDLTASKVDEGITQAQTALAQAKAHVEQAGSVLAQTGESTDAGVTQSDAAIAVADASVSAGGARVRQAEAQLVDLQRGARSQERKQAAEAVAQAQLSMDNAKRDLDRMLRLKEEGAISQSRLDAIQLSYDLAASQCKAANERLSLTEEGPTAEQVASARESVRQAEALLEQAKGAADQARSARTQAVSSRRQTDQRQTDVLLANQAVTQAESQLRVAEAARIQVQTADRDVTAAEAAVAQAQATLQLSQANRAQVGISEEDVQAARAAVQAAQAAAGVYSAELAKRTIATPVAGVIAERMVDRGEVATFGQPLMRIVTADQLYLEATVSELDVGEVIPGRTVEVTVDGVPDQAFQGAIVSVLPAGDTASRNFEVKISLPSDAAIKPGMFARGVVPVEVAEDALSIPKDAIVERDGDTYVFVVENDKAREAKIERGLESRNTVVVKTGLSEGDRVVVVGQNALSDGADVNVIQSGGTAAAENPASPAQTEPSTDETPKAEASEF